MFLLAKYNTQTVFTFPIVKRGVVDLAATADWTPATGDTKISKDGGNVANTSNNPAAIGGTGSVLWTLTLTATELQAAVVDIQIVDSATKAVEDQSLKIYTYGNASAKIPLDLSVSQTGDSFARLGSAGAGLTALGDTRIANLDAAVTTRATPAQVNTEVLDVVNTDTLTLPGQVAPPNAPTLLQAIGHLYKSWRNKKDNDGSVTQFYADNGTTVDQKQSTSGGSTVTKEEIESGP